MSALSPKADIAERHRDLRFVPKADIGRRELNVRFVPQADISFSAADNLGAPL